MMFFKCLSYVLFAGLVVMFASGALAEPDGNVLSKTPEGVDKVIADAPRSFKTLLVL